MHVQVGGVDLLRQSHAPHLRRCCAQAHQRPAQVCKGDVRVGRVSGRGAWERVMGEVREGAGKGEGRGTAEDRGLGFRLDEVMR